MQRGEVVKLCASCVRESETCELTEFDGRNVLMCWECREGPVHGFNFEGGKEDPRTGWCGIATAWKGDAMASRNGNRRRSGGADS